MFTASGLRVRFLKVRIVIYAFESTILPKNAMLSSRISKPLCH